MIHIYYIRTTAENQRKHILSRVLYKPARVPKYKKDLSADNLYISAKRSYTSSTFIVIILLCTFYFSFFSRYVSFKNAYEARKYAIYAIASTQSQHGWCLGTDRYNMPWSQHNLLLKTLQDLLQDWLAYMIYI